MIYKSYFRKTISLVFLFLLIGSIPLQAKVYADVQTRLSENWLFLRSDLGSVWESVRPVAPGSSECVPLWQEVNLPHCFNAFDAVDPNLNYYQGPGWYKTDLQIINPYKDGRTLLDFEGAGQKTSVFVYTDLIGSHIGGYDEWTLDITQAIIEFRKNTEYKGRFKERIPLSIRCDNSRDTEMIPSDLSDFNIYGGLYRHVNLVYVPQVSFQNIFVDTQLDAKRKQASVTVKTNFYNPDKQIDADVLFALIDSKGKVIAEKEVHPRDLNKELAVTFDLKNPMLWSTDQPTLYQCKVTLTRNGESITATEYFGIRDFEFIKKGPFLLNGERLLLRGTHRHEDHSGMAAALTDSVMEREMTLMKQMGVNFIRLGHYQQSRKILELCDRLGILVWEEIPWCRGGLGGSSYQEQARRMLANMIEQHYNHPSVIIWGLGNENDWPNDFDTFDKEAIRTFMRELNDLSHKLDSKRKTAIRRCDFCSDIVDVYSPSIWAGWYRGLFTDYKKVSQHEMEKVNHFLHVEWGGDSHARRHAEDPFVNLDKIQAGLADERAGDASLYGGTARASKDGEWSESYIVRLIDWHLKEQETMPWLTGTAYWPFKDFSTPVRPENPVPYVNQKGVVERDLTPKESYYVFQSYWTTEPMIHIYGHTWPIRWGEENEKKQVLVYSNCSEVELFVNGVSQGIKKRDSKAYPASGLNWDVLFVSGENHIEAVAKGKNPVRDKISCQYETRKWQNPALLEVSRKDVTDQWLEIEVQLKDKDGVPCLDSREYIRFELAGDAQMLENTGTSVGSSKVQAYNGRAIMRVKKEGNAVLAVKSEGVETLFVEI